MIDIQKKIAKRIAAHVEAADDNFSIDPITIIALINVIVSVIRLIYVCYWSEKNIAKQITSNSVIHNLLLSREIRKHFPERNKKERKILFTAIKDVGRTLSEYESMELVQSVIQGEDK